MVSAIKANNSDAIAIQVDMRKIEDVRNLFLHTLDYFGKLDILVNNAAGKNIFKPTAEMTEDEYNSMFDISRGVYFSLQQAAHHIADNGRIVNISSAGTSQSIATGGEACWFQSSN